MESVGTYWAVVAVALWLLWIRLGYFLATGLYWGGGLYEEDSRTEGDCWGGGQGDNEGSRHITLQDLQKQTESVVMCLKVE